MSIKQQLATNYNDSASFCFFSFYPCMNKQNLFAKLNKFRSELHGNSFWAALWFNDALLIARRKNVPVELEPFIINLDDKKLKTPMGVTFYVTKRLDSHQDFLNSCEKLKPCPDYKLKKFSWFASRFVENFISEFKPSTKNVTFVETSMLMFLDGDLYGSDKMNWFQFEYFDSASLNLLLIVNSQLFDYRQSPFRISCINGIARIYSNYYARLSWEPLMTNSQARRFIYALNFKADAQHVNEEKFQAKILEHKMEKNSLSDDEYNWVCDSHDWIDDARLKNFFKQLNDLGIAKTEPIHMEGTLKFHGSSIVYPDVMEPLF